MKKLKDGKVSGKEDINKVRISHICDIKNRYGIAISINGLNYGIYYGF